MQRVGVALNQQPRSGWRKRGWSVPSRPRWRTWATVESCLQLLHFASARLGDLS